MRKGLEKGPQLGFLRMVRCLAEGIEEKSRHIRDDVIGDFRGQVHLQTGPQVGEKGSHPGWYRYVESKKETLELLHTIENQEDRTLGKESHTTE